jgi:hypothetical protein
MATTFYIYHVVLYLHLSTCTFLEDPLTYVTLGCYIKPQLCQSHLISYVSTMLLKLIV